MSHGFHACDSGGYKTCFMSCYWLKVVAQITNMSQLMDLILSLIMSHNRWMTNMNE